MADSDNTLFGILEWKKQFTPIHYKLHSEACIKEIIVMHAFWWILLMGPAQHYKRTRPSACLCNHLESNTLHYMVIDLLIYLLTNGVDWPFIDLRVCRSPLKSKYLIASCFWHIFFSMLWWIYTSLMKVRKIKSTPIYLNSLTVSGVSVYLYCFLLFANFAR